MLVLIIGLSAFALAACIMIGCVFPLTYRSSCIYLSIYLSIFLMQSNQLIKFWPLYHPVPPHRSLAVCTAAACVAACRVVGILLVYFGLRCVCVCVCRCLICLLQRHWRGFAFVLLVFVLLCVMQCVLLRAFRFVYS